MLRALIFSVYFTVFYGFSQNKQLLYGFEEIPQSILQNPGARINNKGYFGIPLLSHIHVNAGSSGISVYDLFAEDGRDFNLKLRESVARLQPNDFTTVTQQLEIFSGGFAFGSSFDKNEYISFGLYQEFDFINYFPKDYAVLALEGNQTNIGRVFDLSDLNLNADMLSVFHIGYNKRVNEKWTYGVRGKIYSSIANINSTNNQGRFVTQTGENNIYQHIFNLNLAARTSGIASLVNDDNSDAEDDIKTLRRRILFGGNLGLGLDLGFTYQMTDQLYFDASLIDIGFIRHSKDIENYEVKGDLFFEGIDPLFPASTSGQTADEFWSEIEDDFEDLFNVDETTTKYTVWRPVKLNASLNYAFGKKKIEECNCIPEEGPYLNRVGAQLFAIQRPKAPQLALTGYYYRRLFNGFSAKVAYTIDSYSINNIGFGFSANIWGLNIYALADNLLQYQNVYDAQSVSLQFGLNYIFRNNED
ncbi:MAG: DUF5723 family protein [Jejuia sp.]